MHTAAGNVAKNESLVGHIVAAVLSIRRIARSSFRRTRNTQETDVVAEPSSRFGRSLIAAQVPRTCVLCKDAGTIPWILELHGNELTADVAAAGGFARTALLCQ